MFMGVLSTRGLYTTYMIGANGGQQRALDPLDLELQTVCAAIWGPLEEHPVLLIIEPSL